MTQSCCNCIAARCWSRSVIDLSRRSRGLPVASPVAEFGVSDAKKCEAASLSCGAPIRSAAHRRPGRVRAETRGAPAPRGASPKGAATRAGVVAGPRKGCRGPRTAAAATAPAAGRGRCELLGAAKAGTCGRGLDVRTSSACFGSAASDSSSMAKRQECVALPARQRPIQTRPVLASRKAEARKLLPAIYRLMFNVNKHRCAKDFFLLLRCERSEHSR